MKFASPLALASFAVSAAYAQSINIGNPQPNTNITPGKISRILTDSRAWIGSKTQYQDSLEGSQEVAIVISLLQCPQNEPCPSPFGELGSILYIGPYNPQFPPITTPDHEPQQNFSVQVPTFFQAGYIAQLAVTHLTLTGAGPFPLFEIRNETLKIC
ncbi:hypothetical protein EI94DRAFT_1742469 [Lactarius quietus]|nr:hypothetical protein EI94DRAFT_1742469 [Lactarius quietus]